MRLFSLCTKSLILNQTTGQLESVDKADDGGFIVAFKSRNGAELVSLSHLKVARLLTTISL
jgi:hypothetical protein